MIPYYSPNLYFSNILNALFIKNAEQKCIEFYRAFSNKKYILLTSSCRVALFLAYSAIEKKGSVIASPLICETALEPIVESGNKLKFSDISNKTFNLDIDALPKNLPNDVIAIQATYFGGRPLNMNRIVDYAKTHKILLIEDCAQGFGSKFENKNLGTFGDISCFSMIKTAYGLSGGVLATNDKDIYEKAKAIQANYRKSKITLDIYRIIRNCIDTYRRNKLFALLFNYLLNSRPKSQIKKFDSNYTQLSELSTKIISANLNKLDKLHNKRIEKAKLMSKLMLNKGYITNFVFDDETKMVPTKLFFYNEVFNSLEDIKKLNKNGIEAKHLQQKHQFYFQDSLNMNTWKDCDKESLPVFSEIHDHIVSIPLHEKISNKTINYIINNM